MEVAHLAPVAETGARHKLLRELLYIATSRSKWHTTQDILPSALSTAREHLALHPNANSLAGQAHNNTTSSMINIRMVTAMDMTATRVTGAMIRVTEANMMTEIMVRECRPNESHIALVQDRVVEEWACP